MRRGVETAHTVWGNSVAILTGDLIFARASPLGGSTSRHSPQRGAARSQRHSVVMVKVRARRLEIVPIECARSRARPRVARASTPANAWMGLPPG